MVTSIGKKWKEDNREMRGGWAPGNYVSRCYKCGCQFAGDKRAIECADCAYGDPQRPASKIMDGLNDALNGNFAVVHERVTDSKETLAVKPNPHFVNNHLLPCPFCGNADISLHPRDLAVWGNDLPQNGADAQYAHCDGCGAEGPQSFIEHEAVENWNRRAQPAASAPVSPDADLLEGMAKALEPFSCAAGVIDKKLADGVLLFAHYPSLFGGQTELRVGDLRRACVVLADYNALKGQTPVQPGTAAP